MSDSPAESSTAGEVIQQYLSERPWDKLDEPFSLSPHHGVGNNQNQVAIAPDGTSWFVKFCLGFGGLLHDICEREALTSVLGRLLDVPVVDAWVIPADCHLAPDTPPDLIRDRCVLMPLLNGSTVQDMQPAAANWIRKNQSAVADVFAFMHWIGDEDRGLSDVMLVNNQLILIDNGLCGPRKGSRLRGYHPTPHPRVYTQDRIIKKCYPNKPSFVRFVLRNADLSPSLFALPDAIRRIELLADEAVREVVRVLGLDNYVAEILIERKNSLGEDYQRWFSDASDLCRPSTF